MSPFSCLQIRSTTLQTNQQWVYMSMLSHLSSRLPNAENYIRNTEVFFLLRKRVHSKRHHAALSLPFSSGKQKLAGWGRGERSKRKEQGTRLVPKDIGHQNIWSCTVTLNLRDKWFCTDCSRWSIHPSQANTHPTLPAFSKYLPCLCLPELHSTFL